MVILSSLKTARAKQREDNDGTEDERNKGDKQREGGRERLLVSGELP